MAAVLQTTFSNAFSWMKIYEFWFNMSLKFLLKGPINKIPTLVQVMAWRRSGDKPLSEPMMIRLLTHICVSRPQWVKIANAYKSYLTMYGKIFWVEFQRVPLKFHPKYLTHTLKDVIYIQRWNLRALRFKSSCAFLKQSPGHWAYQKFSCESIWQQTSYW